jgi:predicted transcriptional regulator
MLNKKQREALVLALAENGKTDREIAKEAGVSPNTIKAVLNKAGLDQTTSESSRAFELYVHQKTPLEVAIALNLEADKAIRYYHEYFKLLGITEFTRVYLQIKDNPIRFVNLFKLYQNSGTDEGEIIELLRIANGYLPRVRLEYDRVKEEKNSLQAELNSWKAALNNEVRTYQQFVDSNIALKKRENELRQTIDELEAKKAELQKPKLTEPLPEFNENSDNKDVNIEVQQEDVISSNDVLIPQPNVSINYNQNENETSHYPSQVEPSFRTVIFDTKDLF